MNKFLNKLHSPGLIVFDLDGTLIDSKKDIADSLNAALREFDLPVLTQSQIERLVGLGAKHLVAQALSQNDPELLEKVFRRFWQVYDQNLLEHTHLYADAAEFLKRTEHWYRAIVTNKPEKFTLKILEGLDLKSRFEWIIGGDTLSIQKPNAAVLEPILEDFSQVPSQRIFIGDSKVDVECGKNAGFSTYMLSHGFGTLEELQQSQPDLIVRDFRELIELEIFQ